MAVRGISDPAASRVSHVRLRRGAPRHLHREYSVQVSSQKSAELQGYHKLIRAEDSEKVKRIAQNFFLPDSLNYSPYIEGTPSQLLTLLNEVKKIAKRIPIQPNPSSQTLDHEDALYYKENNTFINLPYARKTQMWSDRVALQKFVREHYTKLYQEGDLAIVPGCADGQIAIEIYGNSLENGVKLHDIVAADYNVPAMELGYITMKSFGMNPNRIKWIQANIADESFFRWLNKQYPQISGKHQISTLVQPSLREESLLAFLKHCSRLAHLRGVSSTIIMPVLLADPNSPWYKACDRYVRLALNNAAKAAEIPFCIWNKTKYGIEFMKRIQGKATYAPQQYFIDPLELSTILEETKLEDASKKIFDTLEKPKDYTQKEDPRRIQPAEGSPEPASRILCIWETKPKF